MKKRLSFFIVTLFSAAVFSQELPRIAVYVTGEVSDNEKKALGTRMLSTLVNLGRYMGIERTSSFLDEVDKELTKQRNGSINDGQISELGKQFGVKFICIADITPAFGSYQVSARIVDVETAEVVHIG
ncbi:MAG: CsgG/HfaB family protein, partial [Chitinispirillales bacterium]|nr:CsgG/HfaB family protein [Chitinispirillales bacterium]